ncbi:MAG: hypothetical protein HYZ22_00095 [Chloroflexi bacterium]|nr:hypothetical protein [Chloroflexota bacterium]
MKSRWFNAILVLVLASLACNLTSSPGGDISSEETRVALAVQQTSLAIQQATLDADRLALTVPPPAATYTPYPTYTVEPAAAAATEAPLPQVDMKELIKASNVLIYEDVVGDPTLVPVVSNTVNAMNFSGGKIINTGDAMGKFREYANSPTKWDLIIVAAEIRSGFSGELFEVMYDHINNGGAVIIEMWYLDQVVSGKISPILNDCGVTLFRDWDRNPNYDPYDYSIFWLDSSHPLLSTPNIAQAPSYPYPEWFGDAGDLLELSSGGDAVLVGGLHANRKSDYGVLASCLEGRMVIQTFSTHDYKLDLTQALWENYITYTLTKHYEYVE